MTADIALHREAVREPCRRFGVVRLEYLFYRIF